MNDKIKNAIVAGFEKIKDEEYVKAEQFHFTKGKGVLEKLKKDENKKEFQELLVFINSNKKNKKENNSGWYRKIYPENGEPDRNSNHYKVCERINEFVAYCDTHAKGAGEKECIAKAGIRQNDWIKNVLQYLVNVQCKTEQDVDDYRGVTYGVKRAIEYFEEPASKFPILSEKHQELIAKYIDVSLDNFDKELKEAFDNILTAELLKSIDASVQVLDENRTFIYTNIIYDLKSEWEFFDTEFYTTNKNVILTGAPGTGKTYLAKKIAAKIVSPDTPIDVDACSQIGFVQFHPSFDYTDFVEGLRPIQKGTNVGFELKDGIFKTFCAKAGKELFDIYNTKLEKLKNTNKQATADDKKEAYKSALKDSNKYVFIIDEINRGEISKIFGELFFSIDPGYRGKDGKVRTQYANMVTERNVFDQSLEETECGHFFVPENVYIIGTMNDIDRSVESMDFAFRRRFAFKEVTADESKENILFYSDLGLSQENLRKLSNAMDAINEKLTELGLSDCYHIGAAYFQKIKNYSKKDKCDWNALWNYHLQGTLYEYFRGEPETEITKKMELLKEAYDKGNGE